MKPHCLFTNRHQNDVLALSFKIPGARSHHRDKTSMPYFHMAIVLLKLYNPNSQDEANFRKQRHKMKLQEDRNTI